MVIRVTRFAQITMSSESVRAPTDERSKLVRRQSRNPSRTHFVLTLGVFCLTRPKTKTLFEQNVVAGFFSFQHTIKCVATIVARLVSGGWKGDDNDAFLQAGARA